MARMNAEERNRVFAEEAAVVDVQLLLQELMEQKGWTRADMARAMNVSRARVTQIFSDECTNLTIRVLARAFFALSEEFRVGTVARDFVGEDTDICASTTDCMSAQIDRSWIEISDYARDLVTSSANDNIFGGLADLRQARLAETYDLAA